VSALRTNLVRMTVHSLSRTDARRIAVRAQLLDTDRPATLAEVVQGLTLLQIDPTAVIAPNADLVAWSRLGAAYERVDLVDALEQRTLFELRGMIRPAADIVLHQGEMQEFRDGSGAAGWRGSIARWIEANDACRKDILKRMQQDGPLLSREIPDTCAVPWKSSGWTNDQNVTQLLGFMVRRGEVAIAGRRGRERQWDLAERVYPPAEPPAPAEARRRRDERRLSALGIARAKGPECPVEPNDVGAAGEQAVVDGVKGEWRVDPAQLGRPFIGRAALLSPFDRLVFDRKRMTELFEFDYYLEMYKPAAKRTWGYFALPVLYGDRLVGKLDAAADRKAGVLRVNALHQDAEFTKTMTDEIGREIESLAHWLELELDQPQA
jgi:uncharacterized protein YcaQ